METYVTVRRDEHDQEPDIQFFETAEKAQEWADYMAHCGFIVDVDQVKGSAEAAAREAGPGEH